MPWNPSLGCVSDDIKVSIGFYDSIMYSYSLSRVGFKLRLWGFLVFLPYFSCGLVGTLEKPTGVGFTLIVSCDSTRQNKKILFYSLLWPVARGRCYCHSVGERLE
jgi:hypothetical protein